MKKIFVALVLSISMLMMLPGSVGASSPYLVRWAGNGWVPISQSCPSACPVSYWVPSKTNFFMICYRDTFWSNGNYWSNRWFYGYTLNNSWAGWVHSSYVQNQTRGAYSC